jgi:hypothetical protein
MRISFIMAVAVTAFVASCGLSEEQCKQDDWAAIGKADGLRGASIDRIQAHVKSCAKHGISANQLQWKSGREVGLKTYCTPQSAYDVGRNGRNLNNVCPNADISALNAAHSKGRQYYIITREINDLERERADVRSEIRAILANPVPSDQMARIGSLRLQILQIDLRVNHLRLQKRRFEQL